MATLLDFNEQHNVSSSTSNFINFEELFNMELFAGSQQDGTTPPSLSRAGSNSPSTSFFSLPPATPPTVLAPESFNPGLDTAIFDFGLPVASFSKSPPLPPHAGFPIGLGLEDSPTNSASSQATSPYNLFASFSSQAGTPATPMTPVNPTLSPPKAIFAIDPSLVDNPASFTPPHSQSQNQSQFSSLTSIDEEDDSEVSDDDHDPELDLEEPISHPIKVGGKGKARKGTVASGGVTKRSASGGASIRDKTLDPEPDWRPSPEEYKKMSSKEKRQLRNKISARNFRIRRKEYISTLEGDIAERDRLIDAIRSELGSTKSENDALRQEVEALKRAMLEGRANPDLPPPAPLPLTPATTTNGATPASSKRSSSRLSKPNTQKDLPPTSPRASAARAFWGGRGGNNVFGAAAAAGVTSVHATLVPDLFSLAKDNPFGNTQFHDQENINPALNLPLFGGLGVQSFGSLGSSLAPTKLPATGLGSNFDAFADTNPFTFKSLDAYRMQLWGRMAREVGQKQARDSSKTLQQGPPTPQGLASILRPAYFNTPTREPVKEKDSSHNQRYSPSLTALLSGKLTPASSSFSSATSFYPSPPSSPHLSPSSTLSPLSTDPTTQTHAMLASIASQTLLSKLSNAFWDAFARPSPTSTSLSHRGDWDHDKVRRVLEGKAVVKVVDVDNHETDPADSLDAAMKKLCIGKNGGVPGSPGLNSNSSLNSDTCAGVLLRTKAAVIGKKV